MLGICGMLEASLGSYKTNPPPAQSRQSLRPANRLSHRGLPWLSRRHPYRSLPTSGWRLPPSIKESWNEKIQQILLIRKVGKKRWGSWVVVVTGKKTSRRLLEPTLKSLKLCIAKDPGVGHLEYWDSASLRLSEGFCHFVINIKKDFLIIYTSFWFIFLRANPLGFKDIPFLGLYRNTGLCMSVHIDFRYLKVLLKSIFLPTLVHFERSENILGWRTGRGSGSWSICFLQTQISLLPGFSNFLIIPALMYWLILAVCLKPRIAAASFWLMRVSSFSLVMLYFDLTLTRMNWVVPAVVAEVVR